MRYVLQSPLPISVKWTRHVKSMHDASIVAVVTQYHWLTTSLLFTDFYIDKHDSYTIQTINDLYRG